MRYLPALEESLSSAGEMQESQSVGASGEHVAGYWEHTIKTDRIGLTTPDITQDMNNSSTSTASQGSTPTMMEARLLYLENVGTRLADGRIPWKIVNGNGVPISQAQTLQAPPRLFAADSDKRHIIECLTDILATWNFSAEPGWSKWQLHHIGDIDFGYASAIIVRNSVTGGVPSSQTSERPWPWA